MVDYLCREQLVLPSLSRQLKRGRARKYSFGDLVALRGVAKLLQHGVSVLRLKAGLAAIRHRHHEFTSSSVPASFLVTDGENAYYRETREVLEELKSGQLVFAFVLELDGIRKEIVQQLDKSVSAKRTTRREEDVPRTYPAGKLRRRFR